MEYVLRLPPKFKEIKFFIVHFERKNCQTILPRTMNVFFILVIHTDNAKISFVLIVLYHPGGTAINFSISPQNQTTLFISKTFGKIDHSATAGW